MGNTYRKERSFDDRHGHKQKQHIVHESERKQSKNVRVDSYFEDEEDYDEYGDEVLDINGDVRYHKRVR